MSFKWEKQCVTTEQVYRGSLNCFLLETIIYDEVSYVPKTLLVKCIKWRDLPFFKCFLKKSFQQKQQEPLELRIQRAKSGKSFHSCLLQMVFLGKAQKRASEDLL